MKSGSVFTIFVVADRQGTLSTFDHLQGIIVIPYIAPDLTASNPNPTAIVGAGLVPARDGVQFGRDRLRSLFFVVVKTAWCESGAQTEGVES